MKCMSTRRRVWQAATRMQVRKIVAISSRAGALYVLVLVSVSLLLWQLKATKVQYQERDLGDCYLYYTELVKQSPVFRFVNLNYTFSHVSKVPQFSAAKPVIFVVTPTYTRFHQKAELTSMCNTLRHSSNIFWVVIEDSQQKTELVKRFLLHCGIPAVHINFKTEVAAHTGTDQRNAAIQWIKQNTNANSASVVYFADDDNTYDPEIFEEMRFTRKVSVWPVGLSGRAPVEGPIANGGKVVDWASGVSVQARKFPIDMAGFAVNVGFLNSRPAAKFRHDVPSGFSETSFIEALEVEDADLEPRADNCSKMRYTSKVSIWPVGLASEIQAETPILKNGKVVDWVSGYIVNERKFPIDMAGFAISVGFLMDRPLAKFTHDALDGHLESVFLISLGIEDKDFEPRADNCTKVLVWHTQTLQPKTDYFPQTKRGLEIPYWEV